MHRWKISSMENKLAFFWLLESEKTVLLVNLKMQKRIFSSCNDAKASSQMEVKEKTEWPDLMWKMCCNPAICFIRTHFSFISFVWFIFRWLSIVSNRSLNRATVTWFDFCRNCAKTLNRNLFKLYWQLGNWMFSCGANAISCCFCVFFLRRFQMMKIEEKKWERKGE